MVDRMTVTEIDYFAIRDELLRDQDRIVATEQKYMQFLLEVVVTSANTIFEDFSQAMDLKP